MKVVGVYNYARRPPVNTAPALTSDCCISSLRRPVLGALHRDLHNAVSLASRTAWKINIQRRARAWKFAIKTSRAAQNDNNLFVYKLLIRTFLSSSSNSYSTWQTRREAVVTRASRVAAPRPAAAAIRAKVGFNFYR